MRATIDIETSYSEKEYGRSANPFGKISNICSTGLLINGEQYKSAYQVKDVLGVRHGCRPGMFPFSLDGITLLVGHNIGFDLLWYWHTKEIQEFFKRGGAIWDTMVAEYFLSGQFYNNSQLPHLRPSLANVSKRRLPEEHQKLDIVKQLWEQGVRTEDIHEDVLMEYMYIDIKGTDEICIQQIKEARESNMVHMLVDRMESFLSNISMMYNGLPIDQKKGEINRQLLITDIYDLEQQLNKSLPPLPEGCVLNWGSNTQKSAYLFGGNLKYTVSVHKTDPETGKLLYAQKKVDSPVLDEFGQLVYYKSGKRAGELKTKKILMDDLDKPKTKLTDFFFPLPGITLPLPEWAGEVDGVYSTADAVMQELSKRNIPQVNLLMQYAQYRKDLSTYYWVEDSKGNKKGMLTMVCPDGKIHHGLNNTITVTGRLSSSAPNLQNLPTGAEDEQGFEGKSRVKELFVSRFGADGYVGEADYSQLEVVCKAVLSKCPALKEFLELGKCEHCEWASFVYGESHDYIYDQVKNKHSKEWSNKRKSVKPITFGEKYGQGEAGLSKESGIHIDIIKEAIAKRKLKYKVMYDFDEHVLEECKRTRRMSPVKTSLGFNAGIGYFRCETGTLYHFMEEDAPAWLNKRDGILTAFKPTISKNYPSQGLGGLIMQIACGRIWRWLLQNDFFATQEFPDGRVFLMNTVHDCIWVDMHKSVVSLVLSQIKLIMGNAKQYMNAKYPGVNWDLEFPAEVEVGKDMLHLSSFNQADFKEFENINWAAYKEPIIY